MKKGIYDSIVAGAVPIGSGNALDVVSHAASMASDSDFVAVCYSEFEGFAYYIATPSSTLASNPDLATPLAAALPTHPAHQGDGVYAFRMPGSTSIAVKQGSSLDFVTQQPDLMSRYIASLNLPVYEVDGAEPWRLVPTLKQQSIDLSKSELQLAKLAMYTGVLAMVVAIVASAVSGSYVIEEAKSRERQVSDLVQGSLKPQPIFERLVALQRLSGVVARAGGWITRYQYKDTKETWRAELPEWVTKDYMDELGPSATANLLKNEGRIVVERK